MLVRPRVSLGKDNGSSGRSAFRSLHSAADQYELVSTSMRLGIDLDNTIISYNSLFAQLAVESGLVPPDVATNKQSIRDYLRRQGQEDRWTELQGIAYGSRIEEALPFPGIYEFFQRCSDAN